MTNEDIIAMHERETHEVRDPDLQEALSRRYSDAAVILVRLSSGRFAVYNALRELCGVTRDLAEWPPTCWRPPEAVKPKAAPKAGVNLKELGLL